MEVKNICVQLHVFMDNANLAKKCLVELASLLQWLKTVNLKEGQTSLILSNVKLYSASHNLFVW